MATLSIRKELFNERLKHIKHILEKDSTKMNTIKDSLTGKKIYNAKSKEASRKIKCKLPNFGYKKKKKL